MANRNDTSGQVILTCAILLAIVIVIVALMLNNIIFATNVAYLGFMDGSKYDDLSIKQTTLKEAARSYTDESDEVIRTQYMTDYFTAINYLTSSRGKNVDTNPLPLPLPADFPSTETGWNIGITDKDSTVTYKLLTGSQTAGGPQPVTPPVVYISQADTTKTVTEGGTVTLTVLLSKQYNLPVTVGFATLYSGTASAADLTGTTVGTITINPPSQTGTITINTFDDTTYEGAIPETFTVYLDSATTINGVIAPAYPTTSTVNIAENDYPSGGGGSTDTYRMQFVTYTDDRIGSDKDVVKITAQVKNTGTADLSNVQLSLISPVISPTGRTLASGSSPVTVPIGDLPHGQTSAEYVWLIQTAKNGDKIDVQLHATSTEIPLGLYSDIKKNV